MAAKVKQTKDNTIAFYEMGEALGAQQAEFDADATQSWRDALKACKTPLDRKALRAGFVDAYRNASHVSEESAQNRFSYLARLYSPDTSRKAKHNADKGKKKSGRPTEDGAMGGKHIPPQDVALRLAAVLHYVAEAQAKYAGDSDMLDVLGEIAAIAGGKAEHTSKSDREKIAKALRL
jgi:hypothetical protein